MKFLSRYIFIYFAFVLLLSCKGVDDITFTGVKNVQFLGMDNNRISFSADIGVYNPSSAGFRIREVNLKTSLDGIYIGTLMTTEPVRIKAKSDSSYHADFSLEMANMLTGASALYGLKNKKQVTVEMQGFVTARSFLVFRKIDVAEKRLVDVPEFNF